MVIKDQDLYKRQRWVLAMAAGAVRRWRAMAVQADSIMWRGEGRWFYLARTGKIQTIGLVEVRKHA